jgi:integrase
MDHAEAVRRLKLIKDGLARRGGAPSPHKTTVGDLVRQYLNVVEVKRSTGYFDSVSELYRLHIEPSDLARVQLARLTDGDVQAFINERWKTGQTTGKWGKRRVELIGALLSASFNHGRRSRPKLIDWNPLGMDGAVALPDVETTKIRGLTYAQAMALVDGIKGHEHEHLYWLLLATGLRIGEALGLQWPDVDWTRKLLRVEHKLKPNLGRGWRLEKPKTKTSVRFVPLVDEAIEVLEAQLARKIRRIEPDFVFVDQLGEPWTQDSVRHHMELIGRKAGIKRDGPKALVTPHDLRRSAATFLHGQGVPLASIQHVLGHASISTTIGYIDGANEDLLEQSRAAMGRAFAAMRATRTT